MIKEYLKYKRAKEIMKYVNKKMSFWEAKIVEDQYARKLEIKYGGVFFGDEKALTEKLSSLLAYLIKEGVKWKFDFWGSIDKETEVSIIVRI